MRIQRSLPLLGVVTLVSSTLVAQQGRAPMQAFRSETELVQFFAGMKKALPPAVPPAGTCSDTAKSNQKRYVITGRVQSSAGKPIANALLSAIGICAVADQDGWYRLVIPRKDDTPDSLTVVARYIGYSQGTHAVRLKQGERRADFVLQENPIQLQEMVMSSAQANDAAAPAAKDESITNTQHAGVDEGGIVKLHGDYLVVLRRGRLFTVSVSGRDLRPVSMIDAYAPGSHPAEWYDELLIERDRVIVIGYSYSRGGTEVGLFSIDRKGELRHISTSHLRSNDYYSSRNYASRLVNGKLVYYTPLMLYVGQDPLAQLPAIREWRPNGFGPDRFETIVTPRRVYRPSRSLAGSQYLTLHTITTCDVGGSRLECEASVVIGPYGRVFYVSPKAVYVWTADWPWSWDGMPADAMLYRLPLDSSEPGGINVSGTPVDQFSFLESDDRKLNVLVRAEGPGDAMWLSEWDWHRRENSTALLRVPLASFNDGRLEAPRDWYRPLPAPSAGVFHNRFVGNHLLYGAGTGWGRPTGDTATAYVLPWKGGEVAQLGLPHGVDRIEVMGEDAVIVGAGGGGGDLHFSGIRLGGRPVVAQHFVLEHASQGETRSHGFFYKAEDARSGILGLPVRGGARPGYEHLFEGSASILFLRNGGRRFTQLGNLTASPEPPVDDACKASCVDWYGNARPLFLRGRIFALLGYELVEGAVGEDRIREIRRASFAPAALVRTVGH